MVKYLMYIITLLTLLCTSSCETPSKQEFQNLADEFTSAWNRHDSKAMANLWADDDGVNLITPWVKVHEGKKAIEKHFAEDHDGIMKDSELKFNIQNVRMIDSEIAFVDADMTIIGMNVGGEKAVPFNDHAIFLLVKRDGQWKILIARPY